MSMPDVHCGRRISPRRGAYKGLGRWLGMATLLVSLNAGGTAVTVGPDLGQALSPEAIAAVDTTVFPDGQGLPGGRGTAREGQQVYADHCASCHGPRGSGGSAGELAGRSPLSGAHPDQTVGNYWPYATTVFDFIRRAMPMNAPRSLSDDNVYAVTAYLLYLNGIIEENAEINAKSLPAIQMPNREGFISLWPEGR
jgi:mono/diheme cytochrome c family protein